MIVKKFYITPNAKNEISIDALAYSQKKEILYKSISAVIKQLFQET